LIEECCRHDFSALYRLWVGAVPRSRKTQFLHVLRLIPNRIIAHTCRVCPVVSECLPGPGESAQK
jgi:hypothetical protein